MVKEKISHLIFDLGGVIVNLSVDRTIREFAKLSGRSPEQISQVAFSNPLFLNFEKGLISADEFRNGIRSLIGIDCTDQELDAAWNAMCLDIPVARLHWLAKLKEKFHISILSNTNEIHIALVHQLLLNHHSLNDFSSLSHNVFYSHIIHKRKPDQEIYEYVLDQTGFDPSESLFIDDNLPNILGAKQVGINTIHVNDPENIPSQLFDYNINIKDVL